VGKMTELDERRIGWGLGLAGGIAFGVGGLLSLALGTVNLALGHLGAGVGGLAAGIAAFVVAGLGIFFSYAGNGRWSGHALTPGIGLVVVGFAGTVMLGPVSVLAVIGGLLLLLAGVLYLIPPAVVGVKALAAA
jgi:hypothetical protein